MISDNITLDKLMADIDQQMEFLTAIAQDNPILVEQLRILSESREMILAQEMEIQRLAELIDPDDLIDHTTMIDQQAEDA